ncbi:LytR/AlgR family response regulator transcription factor [Undibacterium rugosum]|uniref:LytR/AlgR family response regulator transcription factor n=1 Tax=Undibacterium rugosum TaxID=2762291 RepID=UPI001B834C9A|nr:LytTR family DNA-binding domain-containing protein [Undibacterium rugosum]MBR7776924.1 response regulator transcription factor [Undibacterium rugosum]
MNEPLRVVIADDEDLARRLITEYLKPHSGLHIVAECETGTEAVDAIAKLQPDLVFLDIQMPELTGLEVLETTGRQHGVIFTTAYDQYALRAFDLHAVDYLLKPYSQQRFNEALSKARKLVHIPSDTAEKGMHEARTGLPGILAAQTAQTQRLLIRDRGQTHVVPMADIDFIEAQDDYILVHAGQKSWMKTQSLSDLEAQLDPTQFIRVHRSYLLHLPALLSLEKISKDSQLAVLRNGHKIPVSRSGLERIKPSLL